MRAVDIVQLAVGSLRQRKLRAALPVVGVAVGSFVLIASLAIGQGVQEVILDRKSTRLNSSHVENSYAVSCLKKKPTGFRQRAPVYMQLPATNPARQNETLTARTTVSIHATSSATKLTETTAPQVFDASDTPT